MAKFGQEVADAFMSSIRDLTDAVELQKLIAAIARGDLQGAVDALHLDRAAFHPLEAKLTEAFVAGGQGAVASMPASVSIGFRFDPGNQRASEIIRARAAKLITGLLDTEVQQARDIIADGMARGAHPKSVALDLVGRIDRVTGKREGLIGLSKPQCAAVIAARAELASKDPAGLNNYLTRKRRNRNLDGAVRQALKQGKAVDAATARTMATQYANGLLKLRGEVIGRTEGLPAIRAAKREAYQQLVDDGRVQAQDITRGWHDTADNRTRDTHAAMGGQTVRGLDQPFVSPSGAMMLFPGDTSFGAPAEEIIACRCDESISITRRAA